MCRDVAPHLGDDGCMSSTALVRHQPRPASKVPQHANLEILLQGTLKDDVTCLLKRARS